MRKTSASPAPKPTPTPTPLPGLVRVGRFGAPHGVKGELRLTSFTQAPEAIATYRPLVDASGLRQFALTSLRPVKGNLFVVRVAGITNRTEAEALTQCDLFVTRSTLPAAEDEEFYLVDLIGLNAFSAAKILIGKVTDVLNFGAGDILEIIPAAGGETLLIPFTKASVPRIDLSAGEIVIVPPIEIEGEGDGEVLEPGAATLR